MKFGGREDRVREMMEKQKEIRWGRREKREEVRESEERRNKERVRQGRGGNEEEKKGRRRRKIHKYLGIKARKVSMRVRVDLIPHCHQHPSTREIITGPFGHKITDLHKHIASALTGFLCHYLIKYIAIHTQVYVTPEWSHNICSRNIRERARKGVGSMNIKWVTEGNYAIGADLKRRELCFKICLVLSQRATVTQPTAVTTVYRDCHMMCCGIM